MNWTLLREWFQTQKREFPWRQNPSPYAVWVSEVMLQQTQASVVVPYFERWMKQFPTIQHLAAADLDQVIKAWEGLGYYSRARNLHAGAHYVIKHFKGILPSTAEELSTIKGLGPYTIGAIRSFAFQQKASAVDGNVIRVISRYLLIQEDIAKPKTVNKIRSLVDEMLPDHEPWIISEALIELGATVCTKQPKCHACPLSATCRAYAEGMEKKLPFKSTKVVGQKLQRIVIIISHDDKLCIRRGQKGEIMSDLHEFPYLDYERKQPSPNDIKNYIKKEWKMNVQFKHTLPPVSHSFTKYTVDLTPLLFVTTSSPSLEAHEWMPVEKLKQLAFSSGHRRIFQSLIQQELVI